MKITTFVGISNNKKTLIKMSAIAVVLAYLGFHAISRENGVLAYVRLKTIINEKQNELKKVKEDFIKLERKVKLLSEDSLDLDLLDERCRTLNNLSLANDCIVKVY